MAAKLTKSEVEMIFVIAEDQYMNGDPSSATWTEAVCETPRRKALLGALIRKGMAWSNGIGSDRACGLTADGLKEYESRVTG